MKLFAIGLVCLNHLCFSQNMLVKENGEQLQFKKIKFYSTELQIITDRTEKVTMPADDVTAYYDGKEETMFYKTPGFMNEDTWVESNYEFLEMITEGRITLYKKMVVRTSDYGHPGGRSEFYFAEKGRLFKNVFRADVLRKNKKELIILKALVADDSVITKKLEKENFKFDEANLISVIKEYNVRNRKIDTSALQTQREINFCVKDERSTSQTFFLRVNDTLKYELNTKAPVPIKLSTTSASKVCLIWETGASCEVLLPVAVPGLYYEIVYTKGYNGFVGYNSFEIKRKLNVKLQNDSRSSSVK